MPDATDDFLDFRESYNENLEIIDENMGGGGGSSALEDLSDVNITNPTDGQVLKYDAQNDEWINANGGGGGGSLDAVETDSNAYALLPQADKEDPTKIYFLNDTQSSVVDTPIAQNTFVLKIENQSQMSVSVVNGKLVSVYNYGSSIGACAFEPNAISATASKIKYKFATIGSYDTAQSHAITIGVKASYQSTNWIFSTDTDWLVKKVYNTRNTSVDDYIDISGITTPCYLMICFHGWTVTFDEFLVEDVSTPTGNTEIRYKDVPYGDSRKRVYSPNEQIIGEWQEYVGGVLKKKPVYEKRFEITSGISSGSTHDVASNVERLIAYNAFGYVPIWSITISSFFGAVTNFISLDVQISDATHSAILTCRYEIYNGGVTKIIGDIQYTKTSDLWEEV